MKFALIGCGRIALNHVIVARNNEMEFVAASDINQNNIDILLNEYMPGNKADIARYKDYKKMIEKHPDIDIVAITTPSRTHAEITLYCAEHGINVIVEKPMAMNMDDANEIVRKSEEKGVIVSACHQNRYNLAVQKTKEAIDAGRFGKMSHGAVNIRWHRDEDYYKQGAWRGTWVNDGGCLMNQCIHGIDLLRWMLGDDIDTVYGVTRRQFHDYIEAEDVGLAVVTFKSGAVATIEGTTNVFPQDLEETIHLFGENGTVKIGGKSANHIDIWDFADETDEDKENKGLVEQTKNIYGNGHTLLYADVIKSIENKTKPYIDAVAGRNALEVVLAIYKSMKTGQPVKLPLDDFASTDMKGTFK